ncbi:hypothetical protein CNR22_22115 [Sphingobacteriaceae bacterium]|nr:hypothetical protein CNR22_22115 [Sphingobacteriaceae bacterium]
MKWLFSIVAGLFFFNRVHAQNQTFTLSLYYAINESNSQDNFRRVDSIISLLTSGTCEITIYGYADYLHNTDYNLKLSQKRADEIKKYLEQTSASTTMSFLKCEGLGEKNSANRNDKKGDASQRRVDVIVSQRRVVKKIGTRENVIQEDSLNTLQNKRKPKTSSGRKSLEDLEKGETLAIQGLNFIPGRHVVVKSAIRVLEELLETLKEHPELKIEIQGHICCLDPDEEDGLDFDTKERNLSENRAKAVYNYLVRNGISADRLTYKGYGHRYPKIEVERSPADEQVNRRVEIKILEN